MRHLLVEELQECVPGGNILKKQASATAAEDDNTLLVKAANSLVASHLQKCEYEYTMGIFIPESGTYPDKVSNLPFPHDWNDVSDCTFLCIMLLKS